jgi:uncharacterized protein YdeI (YjbR/CyaY-like superfamily)
LDYDGTLEVFTYGMGAPKKLRKSSVKSVDDAIRKINKYLDSVRDRWIQE